MAVSLQLYFVFYNKHAWSYGKESLPPRQELLILRVEPRALHGFSRGSTREQHPQPWKVLNHRQSFILTGIVGAFFLWRVYAVSSWIIQSLLITGHFARAVVTLTHHLLFGAPCWRCHHLKMSPFEDIPLEVSTKPPNLFAVVGFWVPFLFLCLSKRNTYIVWRWNSYVELLLCYHLGERARQHESTIPLSCFWFQRVISEMSRLFWGQVPSLGPTSHGCSCLWEL